MCRYAFYKYKNTYACFNCQIGFKRRNIFDVQPELTSADAEKAAKCPNCAGEMSNIGRDLRLPPKTKNEQWACIKYLVDNNYNIYSCGCQGIGFVPHKMDDAITLVAEYKNRNANYLKQASARKKREVQVKKQK